MAGGHASPLLGSRLDVRPENAGKTARRRVFIIALEGVAGSCGRLPPPPPATVVLGHGHPMSPREGGGDGEELELKLGLGRGRTRRLDPRGTQPAELGAVLTPRGAPRLQHCTPASACGGDARAPHNPPAHAICSDLWLGRLQRLGGEPGPDPPSSHTNGSH